MIVIKAPAGTNLNVPHPDEVVTLVNESLCIILHADVKVSCKSQDTGGIKFFISLYFPILREVALAPFERMSR